MDSTENNQTEIEDAPATMIEGIVMGAGGGTYEVDVPSEGDDREPILCALGGRLKNPKKERRRFSQPVSVGDRVRVRVLATSGADARGRLLREGFIEEVLPRTSALGRSRYNKTAQITVANLDQVIVVMAARDPDINPHRLDRFLVLAEANELEAVICFNKIDLMKPREQKKELEPYQQLYEKLGYQVILTSAEKGKDTGTKELRAALKDHISAFIGSSGVGKSSLCVMPWFSRVCICGLAMSWKSAKAGTPRPTFRCIGCRFGGYIVDTPGVKTVTLLETEDVALDRCFPEFVPLIDKCKFNDCTHIIEPGCAIKAATAAGTIAASRYESYERLWREQDAMPSVYEKDGRRRIVLRADFEDEQEK